VTTIVYPDATQVRTYDAAGRLARVEEGTGSVEYSYDSLDRLVREVQDANGHVHQVEYQYDNLDRVVRRTVNGDDPTVYIYDKAGRPIGITYRGKTTSYEWDAANRIVAKVLPNGIRQELQHDDAGRIVALTYKKSDGSVIEAIGYSYDAAGQRVSRALSQASVPETPFSAQYDDANRMTGITLTATNVSYVLTYDESGNLTRKENASNPSDVTTYVWDARNRLTAINSLGVSATFLYDPLGRRIERRVNGEITRYVYDGIQALAEIRGGQTEALLNGITIDEAIARYSSVGEISYLTDAVNTVFAQTKSDQSVQNYYAYSPYGEDVALGPDEGNSRQYTGRENDGTALYYYRARYYDPVLKRFISEDPIGLAGGMNVYAYVNGNPISYTDPEGLQAIPVPPIPIPGFPIPGMPGKPKDPDNPFEQPAPPPAWPSLPDWLTDVFKAKTYTCRVRCNVQQIDPKACCPDRVEGTGTGKTKEAACKAAQRDANSKVPRGCYKRHCHEI
jgi:RHS repeat-associated protein